MRLETETTVFKKDSVKDAIKNKVVHGANPTGPFQVGDTWFNPNEGYKMYSWNGTGWSPEQLDTDAIKAGAIKASLIDAGAITADKIAADSITANKLAIGMDNLATVNECDPGSMVTYSANHSTAITVNSTSGQQYVCKKKKSDDSYSQYLPLSGRYIPNIFASGDEIYYSFKMLGQTSARTVNLRIFAYLNDANKTYIGYNGVSLSVTTSKQTFKGSFTIDDTHMSANQSWARAAFYYLVLSDAQVNGTYKQLYVQNITVRKKNTGDMIVGGAIEGSSIRTPIGDGYEVWYVNDKLPNVEYQRAPRDSQITDTYHRLKQEGLQSVDDSDTVRASIISTLLKLYRYDFNSAPIETVYGWYLTGMAYSPRIFTSKGEVATIDPNNPSIKLTLTPETLNPGGGTSAWSTLGGCWRYKVGQRVHLHVAVEDLTADTNTKIFTFIGSGYKPYDTVIAAGRGNDGSTFCSMWVNSSGEVYVRSTSTKAAVDIDYDAFN